MICMRFNIHSNIQILRLNNFSKDKMNFCVVERVSRLQTEHGGSPVVLRQLRQLQVPQVRG